MTKMNSFVKQFVAVVKGDDAEALGMKVWRQCESALTGQISAMNFKTISLEGVVAEAEEKLASARVNNGNKVSSMENYINNLTEAKNTLIRAEKALKDHNTQLDFLKAEYEALKSEK